MIGQKVLHYQITEKLGEGGMGVVYKAEDTKLNRTVALKFLSDEIIAKPSDQERLVNEARAAAGLHHPNICTIYEINEHQGQTFIAMAYVDGVTLRDKVLSSTIETDEALHVTRQIAEGLSQAHKSNIVHRDIKSANIMVKDSGHTQIMDFGLAKQTETAKPDDVFSSGGTSAYMSPEQARGEKVDQRTDIWSLGVILYEMLAGQLPFKGDYVQAVIYSILNEEPPELRECRKDLPEEVAAVVDKCMAKEPAARYQTIDELISALTGIIKRREKGITTGEAGDRSRRRSRVLSVPIAAVVILIGFLVVYMFFAGDEAGSEVRIPIAVIDFNNETDETALDGLSGMLITSLEQSRRLSVMTRTRMFDLLKSVGRTDVEKIDESTGQELCLQAGVGALVIPTIRKFGDLYTIDLKVLDTRRNKYIFTAKEEGNGQESIPSMIDKIARNIRIDLEEETEVVQATTQSVADVTTVSLQAYQHYFKGEQLLNNLDFEGAREEFHRALELDSTFALARYRLAYTQWWWRDKSGKAGENVEKALAMGDRIPEKERYLARALQAGIDDGFAAQIPIYREMQAHYPTDKEMLFGLGDAEFHSENYDSAQVHFEQVLEIDPVFERALQHLTWTYMRKKEFEKSREVAQRWADITGSSEAYKDLGNASYFCDDREAAMKFYETARELSSNKADITIRLAGMYLLAGEAEKSITELRAIIEGEHKGKEKLNAYFSLGYGIYPYQGRYNEAISFLDEGLKSLGATEDVDSSMLAMGILVKGMLKFWSRQDVEGIRETEEELSEFPDKHKSKDYWQSFAILKFMQGDSAGANELLSEHKAPKPILNILAIMKHSMDGDCNTAQAMVDTAFSPEKGDFHIPKEALRPFLYGLAACQVDNGHYDEAIENLQKITSIEGFNFDTALVIPKGYYMLGRAYEGKGDGQLAVKNYRIFLEMWKNADEDLPELVDGKARLAALEAAGSM